MTRVNRRGAMAVLVAVSLPVFLALAAFVIQFAFIDLGRIELRVATDAAAEAAARELSHSGDLKAAREAAKNTALKNKVSGVPCALRKEDVVFGTVTQASSEDRFVFTSGTSVPNAVQINTQLQRNHLFRVLGRDVFGLSNSAIAGQIDRDIALVLDRSGSMVQVDDSGMQTEWTNGAPAPANSRWAMAANAAEAFLNTLQIDTPMEEKVSLITYNGSAIIDDHLTFSYSTLISSIDMYTQAFGEGSTNIADGILKGQETLMSTVDGRVSAAKTIVVMTDGIHNTGSITPVQAAQTAANLGITIHTITYGTNADQSTMQAVATAGGGQHWHAPDSGALNQIFDEIAANLPTMLME